MKAAVSSCGPDLGSQVDPRFGRCSHFVIVDTETGEYQVVNNDLNLNASQGAGIQAAENVSRRSVGAVITGHCGPKAFRVLKAAGIKVYLAGEGTVVRVIEELKQGLLEEAQDADVDGHWS